jgi:hypothetical protein
MVGATHELVSSAGGTDAHRVAAVAGDAFSRAACRVSKRRPNADPNQKSDRNQKGHAARCDSRHWGEGTAFTHFAMESGRKNVVRIRCSCCVCHFVRISRSTSRSSSQKCCGDFKHRCGYAQVDADPHRCGAPPPLTTATAPPHGHAGVLNRARLAGLHCYPKQSNPRDGRFSHPATARALPRSRAPFPYKDRNNVTTDCGSGRQARPSSGRRSRGR